MIAVWLDRGDPVEVMPDGRSEFCGWCGNRPPSPTRHWWRWRGKRYGGVETFCSEAHMTNEFARQNRHPFEVVAVRAEVAQ